MDTIYLQKIRISVSVSERIVSKTWHHQYDVQNSSASATDHIFVFAQTLNYRWSVYLMNKIDYKVCIFQTLACPVALVTEYPCRWGPCYGTCRGLPYWGLWEKDNKRYIKRDVKMPCKWVSLSLGAPLGNLEGIRVLGVSEEKRIVYLGSFLGPRGY